MVRSGTFQDARAGNRERLPSFRAQTFPRAVRLPPTGIFTPAGALRFLLRQRGSLDLFYTGFCLEPWLKNGQAFTVIGERQPAVGDLILCEAEGFGDVRRVLARTADGAFVCALDSFPPGREAVPPERVLGVVTGRPGAGGRLGRALARAFPVWSRAAYLRYWLRKIQEMPDFVDNADKSVENRSRQMVDAYLDLQSIPLGEEFLPLIQRHIRLGGALLVAGCGAGREALYLARAGYSVSAFDLAPAMVDASRASAARANLKVECFQANMVALDLEGRRFDGVYVTPLVYSIVRGRENRVEALRRLGRHLSPGGRVLFSAHLFHGPSEYLRAAIVWARRLRRGPGKGKFGDWYTWFLTPAGTLGTAFTHRFIACRVRAEVREAGYHFIERERDGSFVAGEFVE